jgi:tetratricopeptide (TPR) repeat protein
METQLFTHAPRLLRQGLDAQRANNAAGAIERLSEAVERDAGDSQAQFQLGVALQAMGRHPEALARFKTAQALLKDDAAPFLHAAVSFLALGDNQAALQAASEACWRAPKLPATHYAYGQAWAAVGEPARAEQAFAAAIQLNPRWADAWVNYGLGRYRQGAVEDAKTAMRKALVAEPSHDAALANLGAFMRISGESEAADRLLRESLARAPEAAGARLNLAADLLQEERPAEALALLDGAETPSDKAALRHWRLEQALAMLQLGRAAEAREAVDDLARLGPTPPALAPLVHWRLILLALAEGDPARALDEAAKMEQALDHMGPDAVPEHAIMARFDLAKFWSQQALIPAPSPSGEKDTSCSPDSSRSRATNTAPSSMIRSRRSALRGSRTDLGRRIGMERRSSSWARRVRARRSSNRSSPPTAMSSGQASAPRSEKLSPGSAVRTTMRHPRGASPRSMATLSTARRSLILQRCMRLRRTPSASSTRCPATFSTSVSSG